MEKLLLGALALSFFACTNQTKTLIDASDTTSPHDFMFMQRAYPSGEINTSAFAQAIQWKKQSISQDKASAELWEFVGPLNTGGRITDVEIPIDDANTYYVGTASGGIFKTIDGGVTFNPIFDDQENISKMCFKDGDVLLRINFFGLRSFRSNDKIKIPVIEDHTHGLFSDWALSSDADWCFSSIRKSLPVADGGILWSPTNNTINIETKHTTKEHHELVKNRYSAMKIKSQYFLNKNPASKNKYLQLFKETEESFTNNPSSLISQGTLTLLNKIPLNIDDSKRLNFKYLLPKLDQHYYKVLIPESDQTAFSLVIILESQSIRDDLRSYLIKNNIYPAIFWKLNKNISSDQSLMVSNRILSIHIDFRYNFYDLDTMCKILNSYNLQY